MARLIIIKRSIYSIIYYVVYCLFMFCISLCSPWEIGVNAHTLVFFSVWVILMTFCECGFIILFRKYVIIHFVPYFFVKKIKYSVICEQKKILNKKQWHFRATTDMVTFNINGKLYTFSTNNNEILKKNTEKKTRDGSVCSDEK